MQTTMGALRFDFINCSAAGTASREFLWLAVRGGWIFAAKQPCGRITDYTHCRYASARQSQPGACPGAC